MAFLQFLERFHQHFRVKGIGVVIVELGPLFIRHVVMRLVVVVVMDDRHVASEALDQPAGDRGLAAAGAAGNAEDHDIAAHIVPPVFSLASSYHTCPPVSI